MEPDLSVSNVTNGLLKAMPPSAFERLAPALRRVPLSLGSTLARIGDRIETLCFPEEGVVGFVGPMVDGSTVATAIVGREGLVGWPLLLHQDNWPHEPVARATDGLALVIEREELEAAMRADDAIRPVLLNFVNNIIAQMGQTIASNLMHDVEKRLARWILLYHDRVPADEIILTHQELGNMLGVRRPSITEAINSLEGKRMIRGRRGRFSVVDREGLMGLAGNTYTPA